MLFLKKDNAWQSIGFATNHTLSVSADTKETTNKDEGNGDWQSSEVGTLSWSVTTENLMDDTKKNGATYDTLFDIMTKKEHIKGVFGPKTDAEITDTNGWTPDLEKCRMGDMIITSLEENAQNGENVTFSATFTGVGALKKYAAE